MAENDGFSSASQDEVSLEVRRTLDFFESTFNQPSVAAIYLLPTLQPLPDLRQALADRLNVRIKEFDITRLVTVPKQVSQRDLVRSLPAIGAAIMANFHGEDG